MALNKKMARPSYSDTQECLNIEAFEYDEEYLKQAKKWISFYREYPFRLCSDYLNINLKPFQCVLLYQMMKNTNFCFVASRGIGKTWLTAVFCIVRCILFPRTEIVIAAGVKDQAYQVIGKIKDIYADSPMLKEEILYMSESVGKPLINFKNGSKIQTVASTENARSFRCNALIMDEFRLIDKQVADQVLRKFKSNPRMPKYLEDDKYKHLQESNIEILMTSAYLKSHWCYARYRSFFKQMMKGKTYFVCNLSYHIGIKSGIKLKQDIINEMTEEDFDPVWWKVEMCGYFLGENQNAFYSRDEIEACRKINTATYPKDIINMCNDLGKNKDDKYFKDIKKKDEIRIVFADIALMSSKKHENDASCFGLMRLIPNQTKTDYIREVTYLETCLGTRSEIQALRIRELYTMFNADYIICDTMGIGLPIFDMLVGNQLMNKETGLEYEPLGCMNDPEMHERSMYPSSKKVIFSFKGDASRNSEMAILLQNAINSRRIRFLIDENTAMNERIMKLKAFDEYSTSMLSKLKHPYLQMSFAIQEMLNLEGIRGENGKIKIKEISGRKDRFSAIAMANYLASELARDTFKVGSNYDEEDDVDWYFVG